MSVLFFVESEPSKISSIQSFNGQWKGVYKNTNIVLEMKKDNSCMLEFHNVLSSLTEILNGACRIDKSKSPNTFIMTKIDKLNTSLYSLIVPINKNTIHFSEFSTRWKLRSVSLINENTIILKRQMH
ncbi:hypothetical protein OAK13_06055 [Candidatus Thioglobus sp.]|nr:hypothetical protein [Candidatus Thioglobus sp.]